MNEKIFKLAETNLGREGNIKALDEAVLRKTYGGLRSISHPGLVVETTLANVRSRVSNGM